MNKDETDKTDKSRSIEKKDWVESTQNNKTASNRQQMRKSIQKFDSFLHLLNLVLINVVVSSMLLIDIIIFLKWKLLG